MKVKKFGWNLAHFWCLCSPAQPGPTQSWSSLTDYFSVSSEDAVISFKIVSNFKARTLIDLETKAFLVKPFFYNFFHKFLRETHEQLSSSKIWLFHMKERHNIFYQNHLRFGLKNKCYYVKNWIVWSIRQFFTWLFLKVGSERELYGWFKRFKIEYKHSNKEWWLLSPRLISPKTVIIKVSGVQRSIRNTAEPI